MIHVCTTGGINNGIAQRFHSTGVGTAPQSVTASVWVFVVRGQVALGIGHDGLARTIVSSTTTGQWEQLHTQYPSPLNSPPPYGPPTSLILYSTSPEGACFYADVAKVV